MAKKVMTFKTKGMNKDLSVSAFNPEFSFNNLNLRLSTNEDNTLLSWVNERGTEKLDFVTGDWKEANDGLMNVTQILGTPIGTAVINNQLILFTHSNGLDYIYLIRYDKEDRSKVNGIELFHGDLNFDVNHPLETLVSYESKNIQKVYWVDGKNQPRLINVAADISNYYDEGDNPINTVFDFIRELELKETIDVSKISGGLGEFPAGVIQYAFTYYTKYGQESNIFHTTPLYYISYQDRGGSQEDKITVSFKIDISEYDVNFEYIRIYSIIRTSINGTPIVKKVQDIQIPDYFSRHSISPALNPDFNNTTFTTSTEYDNLDDFVQAENIQPDSTFPQPATYNFSFEAGDRVYEITKGQQPNLKIGIGNTVYTWNDGCGNDTIMYIIDSRGRSVPDNTLTIFCEEEIESSEWQRENFVGVSTQVLSYIDTNTIGESVDPTHLLYLGGESIIAQTIEQKDNTLFLGNLSTPHSSIDKTIKEDILDENGITSSNFLASSNVTTALELRKFVLCPSSGSGASRDKIAYINTLAAPEGEEYKGASAFKTNEYYRLGVQFQDKTGRWSEPCWIGDQQMAVDEIIDGVHYYGPKFDDSGTTSGEGRAYVPIFKYTIPHNSDSELDIQIRLYNAGYRRARAVFAQPQSNGRTILCQGVACPTMYRTKDRDEQFAYAQSSWIFRTNINASDYHGFLDHGAHHGYIKRNAGAVTPYGSLCSMYWNYEAGDKDTEHNPGLAEGNEYPSGTYYIREWDPKVGQWLNPTTNTNRVWMPYYRSTEVMGVFDEANTYKIDLNFCTINSPDIEFLDTISNSDLSSASLKGVGYTDLTATYGDINITTSTDSIKPGRGFRHDTISTKGTSALISGNFYEDHIVIKDDDGVYKAMYSNATRSYLWPVHMWHRDGSLNNDVTRAAQSAKLLTKVISNYRLGGSTYYFSNPQSISTYGMEYYGFTEAEQLIKVNGNIYKGCVNITVQPSKMGDYYPVGLITKNNGEGDTVWGIDGNITDIASWDPTTTDLPILKLHSNNPNDPDNADWVWIIQWWGSTSEVGYDGWSTTKIMPDYNSWPVSGVTKDYRWNTLGDNDEGYEALGDEDAGLVYHKSLVPIKYKSTPHVAAQLNIVDDLGIYHYSVAGALPVVEICKEYNKDTFLGGGSESALQSASWIPCGPIVSLDTTDSIDIEYKWGDTYFQRYECLKTYPYTFEDRNQVVEIGSFMLETRVNLDGRYDRNRGRESNLNVSPQNFNLINPVYSQLDNFFNYRILPEDYYSNTEFANQITWTTTKESGAEIDAWTNITLASVLDLDGSCGQLNRLIKFNDQLLAFQDTGISQILYNENTQISTTAGVPIEIANSGKVTGKRYFSNTIGCSNKWSVLDTPEGVYFMDSNNKGIYAFSGELSNLSNKLGFNTWCKQNIPTATIKWNPSTFGQVQQGGISSFVSYYDRKNQDVLFINKDTALALSEKLGTFTSFYDYGDKPYFCNLEDTGIWVTKTGELWRHQTGNYCRFFGVNKPYSITLVGNPEPQTDKTFTNLEFRACIEGEPDTVPFDSLEVWDEYQHGIANLSRKTGIGAASHHLQDNDKTASLNRKFRMWRCDIPRDNYTAPESNSEKGITRTEARPLDRMRNPWVYLELQKNRAEDYIQDDIGSSPSLVLVNLPKVEIHDIVMTYYN